MIAYVDASVLLRVILRQPDALREWTGIERGVASVLVEVECLRTLDRLRLRFGVPDREIATRRETVFRVLESIELVEIGSGVLARAAQPLPTELGTLDAIHLATATVWRESTGAELFMATHDEALATAARANGFRVLGVS